MIILHKNPTILVYQGFGKKGYRNNSLHLARKYALIFVRGH